MITHLRFTARRAAAFTMVEIALCIGIVAFALVAILGVLPTGFNVKKDNREDTIIQEDATFFLEAIKGGSRGLDHLTNFVEFISHDLSEVDVSTSPYRTNVLGSTGRMTNFATITPAGSPPNQFIQPGALIIGRLSAPDWAASPRGTNFLRLSTNVAYVRAITGTSIDQGKANRDFAFRYKLSTELIPYSPMPRTVFPGTFNDYLVGQNLSSNMYELRLTMQWPIIQRGSSNIVGRSRKVFRSLLSGTPQVIRGSDGTNYYFFQPHSFVFANAR